MSWSKETHVGPYLVCGLKNNKLITIKVPLRGTCSNTLCKNYKKEIQSNYCSECGSKATEGYEEKSVNSIDVASIEEEISLSLFFIRHPLWLEKKDINIWVSNRKLKIDEIKFNMSNYVKTDDITGDIIEKHKKIFAEEYADEIAVIKKHYGEDQVRIEWGVFNYAL